MSYSNALTRFVLAPLFLLLGTGCCNKSSHTDGSAGSTAHPTTTSSGANHAPTSTPTSTTTAKTDPKPDPKSKSPHLALGIPKDGDTSDDFLITKKQYALSYSKRLNNPNWVSWNTDAGNFGDVPRFNGQFMQDDDLPSGFYRVSHNDYTGSGYDRGHMVRSEERTKTDEDNKATFYTTNILPQYHDLNAGPWLRLEEYVQKMAQKDKKELYIVAGGIFEKSPKTIGKGVAVPKDCYKIITVLDRGGGLADVKESTRVIAVIMPNVKGIIRDDWGKYRVTVDKIEQETGYDFMPDVPDAIQKVIESKVDNGPTD